MSGETLPVVAEPRGRRLVRAASLVRLGRIGVTVALLAVGIVIGLSAFQARQANDLAPAAGDPVTAGIAAPSVVHELAAALAANDTDRVRAAVPGNPYGLLAREIETWSFTDVTSVVTLSTFGDETRTATELVIRGRTAAGSAILVNLIVHAEDGLIVNFR